MRVFEITGGVGSGKSEVLKYLEEAFGASVCQLDEVARQMQKRGTIVDAQSLRQFIVIDTLYDKI